MERFIAVKAITEQIGQDVCNALSAARALTGCSTISTLFKIGKHTAVITLVQYGKMSPNLSELSTTQFIQETLPAAHRFTLSLNQKRGKLPTAIMLDELRLLFAKHIY